MKHILLEVCVDSVESAIAAVNGGADRLEICANLGLGGGTTPSLGLVKAIHYASPTIPFAVMIRPRVGDFLYSDHEFDVMLEDVRSFKRSGDVSGIVFGILTADGRVDVHRSALIAEEASPLEVCFHRAFDMSVDAVKSYEEITAVPGVTRILTSGLGPSASNSSSLETIQSLLRVYHFMSTDNSKTPCLLIGSGINSSSIGPILDSLRQVPFEGEIHMSGGQWIDSRMEFRREDMGMGMGGPHEWGIWQTSEEAVRKVREVLDTYAKTKT